MSDTSKPTAYEVLGVSLDVSEADLRRAYRAQALKVHPDHVSNAAASYNTQLIGYTHLSAPTIP